MRTRIESLVILGPLCFVLFQLIRKLRDLTANEFIQILLINNKSICFIGRVVGSEEAKLLHSQWSGKLLKF